MFKALTQRSTLIAPSVAPPVVLAIPPAEVVHPQVSKTSLPSTHFLGQPILAQLQPAVVVESPPPSSRQHTVNSLDDKFGEFQEIRAAQSHDTESDQTEESARQCDVQNEGQCDVQEEPVVVVVDKKNVIAEIPVSAEELQRRIQAAMEFYRERGF